MEVSLGGAIRKRLGRLWDIFRTTCAVVAVVGSAVAFAVWRALRSHEESGHDDETAKAAEKAADAELDAAAEAGDTETLRKRRLALIEAARREDE